MAGELEKTCENCEYENEDMEGTHCRHCIHNAEEHFEPKTCYAKEEEIRNKAIDEFSEKLIYELKGNIFSDEEKFKYTRKQQEQICHQNTTLKRAIKYVEIIAEQLKGEK